jgi:hypothetical protein
MTIPTKAESAAAFSKWLDDNNGRVYGSGKTASYGDIDWLRGSRRLAKSMRSAVTTSIHPRIAAAAEQMMSNPVCPTNSVVARLRRSLGVLRW